MKIDLKIKFVVIVNVVAGRGGFKKIHIYQIIPILFKYYQTS